MIRTEDLEYIIDSFSLHVSLEVEDSEYFVLLGMTGSGKTLLLENLCGLRQAEQGRVHIGRHEATYKEPRARNIGYVPQDGALFEHLNVAENIGFSLKVKKVKTEERDEEVRRTADLLGIGHLLERPIRGLSGGERQRVALGRALASRPEVLLLDEPVSALDEFTREGVLVELKKIQKTLNLSVIHVCHSFEEANLVADRIGIMHNGKIVQTGTADDLLNHPASVAVANVVRLENVFYGQLPWGPRTEGPVTFCIRSSQIELAGKEEGTDVNILEGEIEHMSRAGIMTKLRLKGSLPIVFYVLPQEIEKRNLSVDNKIKISFPNSAIFIFKNK
jgi:ABC-type sugar transport system ATPase subunit